MSHPWITNCTSCHVPADGMRQFTEPREARLVVENSFIGKNSAGSGPRAYGTAPPTTPHPVWMRRNCMACHGPGREQAIRTSHPERQNCLQCHAPNAAFDNRETYLTNPKPPLGFRRFFRKPWSAISRRDLFRSMFGRRPQHVEPPVEETIRRSPAADEIPPLALILDRFCLAYQGSFCSVCSERCPAGGAITVEQGKPRVNPDFSHWLQNLPRRLPRAEKRRFPCRPQTPPRHGCTSHHRTHCFMSDAAPLPRSPSIRTGRSHASPAFR